ncbi:MAG: DUF4159 domain-containing protein [Gemmatimonadaceae bacterium]
MISLRALIPQLARSKAFLVALGACALAAAPIVWAQGRGRGRPPMTFADNRPYDGRYTFVRIKYPLPDNDFGFRQDIKWSHDYPRGEQHFSKIVQELTSVQTRTGYSNILGLDDPELGKYPIAYMCEPGFWRPTDVEVLGLRNYLEKGGFIIFDDFAGQRDWQSLEQGMKRAFPTLTWLPLDPKDIVFDAFYHVNSLEYYHPLQRVKSEFLGLFEDNDRAKRMLAVANYNNDISEYWEFSDEGMFAVDESNEAYKIGVNYIIYALTR